MSLCVRITFLIFVTGLVFEKLAIAQQCNGPRQLPIHDMTLQGHTYKKLYARSGHAECLFICRKETLCQSFNFVKNQSICEFNNRTKEASPENFVANNERYYVKLDVSRGKHFVFLTLFFFPSHLLTNESQRKKCLGHFCFRRPAPSLFAKIGPWSRKGSFILGYASLATVSQIILVTATPQTERPFVYDTCGF